MTTARAAWDGKGVLSLMLCTAERPGPGQALQFLIDCVGSADWDLNVFFLVDDSGGARGFSSVRREGRTWIYSVAPPGPGSYKIHCSFSTDGGKSYSWGTTQVFDCRIGAPVFPAEGSVTAPYPWFDQAFFDLGISFATPNRGWVRVAEGPAEILEVVMPPELTPGVSFFTPDGAQVHDEQASVTKRGDRWIVTVSPKSPGEYRLSLFAVREGRWSWLCMLRVDY